MVTKVRITRDTLLIHANCFLQHRGDALMRKSVKNGQREIVKPWKSYQLTQKNHVKCDIGWQLKVGDAVIQWKYWGVWEQETR